MEKEKKIINLETLKGDYLQIDFRIRNKHICSYYCEEIEVEIIDGKEDIYIHLYENNELIICMDVKKYVLYKDDSEVNGCYILNINK